MDPQGWGVPNKGLKPGYETPPDMGMAESMQVGGSTPNDGEPCFWLRLSQKTPPRVGGGLAKALALYGGTPKDGEGDLSRRNGRAESPPVMG